MSEQNQLEQLIIKNLNIIETANQLLPKIHETVFEKIDSLVKKWTEHQGNWTGKFTFSDEYELYFNPKSWIKEDNDYSCFYLYYSNRNEKENDNALISLLCGAVAPKNENYMRFHWNFPYKDLGNKKKREWKTQLNDLFFKYQSELTDYNIELDHKEGQLFRRIEIDSQLLADNYPENIEDALTPISDALADIEKAYPIIEKIYQAAISE